MQELLMVLWLAFNLVFGLWTLRNLWIWVRAKTTRSICIQSDLGKVFDLIIRTSIVTQLLYVYY